MTESTSETPVLDLLGSMTADSLEASSLDMETLARPSEIEPLT